MAIPNGINISGRRIPRVARTGKSYAATTVPRLAAGGNAGTQPTPEADSVWDYIRSDEGETLYVVTTNAARVESNKGEAYLEAATLPGDGPYGQNPDERRVRLSPEGVVWSDNIQSALFEVKRAIFRGLDIASPTPELAFWYGVDKPLPTTPMKLGFKATEEKSLAVVCDFFTVGGSAYIQGFIQCGWDLAVGGNMRVTGDGEVNGDLKVGGDITAPLATASKKGVVSVNITGSGDTIANANINNGVLTLTRGSSSINVAISGTGNTLVDVTFANNTLTFTKGLRFSNIVGGTTYEQSSTAIESLYTTDYTSGTIYARKTKSLIADSAYEAKITALEARLAALEGQIDALQKGGK
jgi:hypothetical protein